MDATPTENCVTALICADMRFGEVTYAVTNAALLSKRLVDLFFEHEPLLDELARKKASDLVRRKTCSCRWSPSRPIGG